MNTFWIALSTTQPVTTVFAKAGQPLSAPVLHSTWLGNTTHLPRLSQASSQLSEVFANNNEVCMHIPLHFQQIGGLIFLIQLSFSTVLISYLRYGNLLQYMRMRSMACLSLRYPPPPIMNFYLNYSKGAQLCCAFSFNLLTTSLISEGTNTQMFSSSLIILIW